MGATAPRRRVQVGKWEIGGGQVLVEGMTKTDTRDLAATAAELSELALAGCELVRLAVPDGEAVEALQVLCGQSPVPLIADIHFDYRLALAALEAGVHQLRLNPGNIGGPDRLRKVAQAARERGVSIRVGVNSGSLERDLLEKHGRPEPAALVASVLRHCRLLEDEGFFDIMASAKSPSVLDTVAAYRLLAASIPYPLHVGITEAGTRLKGAVRSAVGLGLLLAEGIGDTLRVSLAAPAVTEVEVAFTILASLGLRQEGVRVIACPTCGRAAYDIRPVAEAVEERLRDVGVPFTVAVMGCEVNGPGEARQADVGLAAGPGRALLFSGGRVLKELLAADIVEELVREVRRRTQERG
ncbi:MAG TPA: 4-hydroxy-3-methylbut-2-en-1-yl diphosphate synthase [Clostridiales bacterium UBA8153]|nr:4-hydroxy-3-methylbut-2-en-1-yl diphosphate synthase [Clostridiales bacterium UBA8153]